jgi:hypothetical protein
LYAYVFRLTKKVTTNISGPPPHVTSKDPMLQCTLTNYRNHKTKKKTQKYKYFFINHVFNQIWQPWLIFFNTFNNTKKPKINKTIGASLQGRFPLVRFPLVESSSTKCQHILQRDTTVSIKIVRFNYSSRLAFHSWLVWLRHHQTNVARATFPRGNSAQTTQ